VSSYIKTQYDLLIGCQSITDILSVVYIQITIRWSRSLEGQGQSLTCR